MKIAFFIIISLILKPCFGQQFEGKIVYQNSFHSKDKDTQNENLNQLYGYTHIYQIKNGNYKLSGDGALLQWQIYIAKKNKLFVKIALVDKPYINNLNKEVEKIKDIQVNRKSTNILNHLCDEFIIHCINSTQKYYIDSSLNINSEIFKNSKFNLTFAFLLNNQILPFKMITENEIGICESVAIEMKEEKIDDNIFIMK